MIPCALPLAQYQARRDAIVAAVTRVMDGGAYVLGPEVARFEEAFAAYCGVACGVGVNSGTDALTLALKACGIGPGDEVVTVSHTAIATVAAVLAAGAVPVLADVDPEFYTLDPQCFAAAITPRTKAVVAVHLYGQPADMDAIVAVAGKHALPVIEDCAQAAGGSCKGRRVGSLGEVACFSFYPTKNLGALGDGGMVVTNDRALAERVRRLRQYGWDNERATQEPGLNSRLDELQAAILDVKLPFLDADNARRIDIARRYGEALSDLPLTVPRVRPQSTHVYHLYVLACDDRNGLKKHLAAHQVVAGIHYPVPAHRHRGYDSRVSPAGVPVTESLAGRVLSLPLYPELEDSAVEQVIQAVRSYYV